MLLQFIEEENEKLKQQQLARKSRK